MKKLICILASAALLGACEQKTEVVVPASTPAPAADMSAMGARTSKEESKSTLTAAATPEMSTETKTETKTETETTTTIEAATPNP